MKTLIPRAACVLFGHRWGAHTPLHRHDFCQRCKRYDDAPQLLRDNARRAFVRRWSPVGLSFRRGIDVRVGVFRPMMCFVRAGLHFGWDRSSELPGVSVSIGVWRLRLYAALGHGWQDEDCENRTLVNVSASFQTYGLRYIGCWFGHDVHEHEIGRHVFIECNRCDATLEHRRPEEAVVGG